MKKILILIMIAVFSGCKKYPDDSGFVSSTAKARICRTWKIVQYLENGQDKTSGFNIAYPNYKISFNKKGNYTANINGYYSIGLVNKPVDITETGSWGFSDKKNGFTKTASTGSSAFFLIKKLSTSEMHLTEERSTGTNTYILMAE